MNILCSPDFPAEMRREILAYVLPPATRHLDLRTQFRLKTTCKTLAAELIAMGSPRTFLELRRADYDEADDKEARAPWFDIPALVTEAIKWQLPFLQGGGRGGSAASTVFWNGLYSEAASKKAKRRLLNIGILQRRWRYFRWDMHLRDVMTFGSPALLDIVVAAALGLPPEIPYNADTFFCVGSHALRCELLFDTALEVDNVCAYKSVLGHVRELSTSRERWHSIFQNNATAIASAMLKDVPAHELDALSKLMRTMRCQGEVCFTDAMEQWIDAFMAAHGYDSTFCLALQRPYFESSVFRNTSKLSAKRRRLNTPGM